MNSRTTKQFRDLLTALPETMQHQAKNAYQRFRLDPKHNSLNLKQVHPQQSIYSVRISKGYRAVGKLDDKGMLWFWIGSHSDYDKLLSKR